MRLTDEQKSILEATGDIKINAVAGSGKTTTIIEYAKRLPSSKRILYLAFNKSVRQEAQKRFEAEGLSNVTVETAHSLAYKHVVYKYGYSLNSNGYKVHEIAELLGLSLAGDKHDVYVAANHINRLMSFFCNSNARKVQELDYIQTVSDPNAQKFVSHHYDFIERQARILLAKMNRGDIDITHDFYLKKFQLSSPRLTFDTILFDEGQDASPAMLDVFLKQNAQKIIVGDSNQQIYSWRYAVNSLDDVPFSMHRLTNSFRFGKDIAELAASCLDFKNHITDFEPVSIRGKGKEDKIKTRAVLARTNLGLLLRAIEMVTGPRAIKRLYFEGNINSYTYGDEGASLYDVMNLNSGKIDKIRDPLIRQMPSISELEEYSKKTEDVQLSMMIDIVKEYGTDIPKLLAVIRKKHVTENEKHTADIIFSTVHRSKGMEYDEVELVNDFITEDKVKKPAVDTDFNSHIARLNEEINLLYVAITRTRCLLKIPDNLLPEDFSPRKSIRLITNEPMKSTNGQKVKPLFKEKSYSVDEKRKTHKAAYKKWSSQEEDELTRMYENAATIHEMASHFNRTKGAINSRLKKLMLIEN